MRARANPLARHNYPRRAALQRDLDRYYRECLESPSTRTRTGGMAARQAHCAKISWSRVKAAGRFKDYFEGPGYYAHGAAHENPGVFDPGPSGAPGAFWLVALLGIGGYIGYLYGSSKAVA